MRKKQGYLIEHVERESLDEKKVIQIQYLKYKRYQIYFEMSEYEDTDSILRNIDIDKDIEIENEF